MKCQMDQILLCTGNTFKSIKRRWMLFKSPDLCILKEHIWVLTNETFSFSPRAILSGNVEQLCGSLRTCSIIESTWILAGIGRWGVKICTTLCALSDTNDQGPSLRHEIHLYHISVWHTLVNGNYFKPYLIRKFQASTMIWVVSGAFRNLSSAFLLM